MSGNMRKCLNPEIKPNTAAGISFSEGEGTWFTGVSGEASFEMENGEKFSIGLSNPYYGTWKGLVIWGSSSDGEAYDQMTGHDNQTGPNFKSAWDTTVYPPTYTVVIRKP